MNRFRSGASGKKPIEVMLFTSRMRGHTISLCPITTDVHFDHLVKVGSASLPTVKLLFFSLSLSVCVC